MLPKMKHYIKKKYHNLKQNIKLIFYHEMNKFNFHLNSKMNI